MGLLLGSVRPGLEHRWVSTEAELRAPDKVYYPSALRLAPTPSQPLADPNPVPPSSSDQPALTPSDALNKDNEPEQPAPADVVDMETKEVTEVAQLKGRIRRKSRRRREGKGRRL